MISYICDWTWRQGILPVDQIVREGFNGVKLKAGGSTQLGWSFVDTTFVDSAIRLRRTELAPMVYWYLVPDRPRAQAGLFADLLDSAGGLSGWIPQLDVEMPGLTAHHVNAFIDTWRGCVGAITPPIIYTRRTYWEPNIDPNGLGLGAHHTPHLEEAHWVPLGVRDNPETPYASQQAKAVDPAWWDVNYSGWRRAHGLQFTDRALVAGKRTCCSIYPLGREELKHTYAL